MISKFILILLLTLLSSLIGAAEETSSEDKKTQENSEKNMDPDVIKNVLENLGEVGDIKEEKKDNDIKEEKEAVDIKEENKEKNIKEEKAVDVKVEGNIDSDVIQNLLENLGEVGDIIEGAEKSADKATGDDSKAKVRKARAAGTPGPTSETATKTPRGFDNEESSEVSFSSSEESEESHFNCGCVVGSYCKCCSHIKISKFELDTNGCIEVEHLSKDLGLNLTFILKDEVVFSKTFAALTKDPLCFDFPGLLKHFGDFCIHMKPGDDTLADESNVCMNLEPRVLKSAIKTFKVGCFDLPKKN